MFVPPLIANLDEFRQRISTALQTQADRILDICEIGHEIHISLNFSFKVGSIILMLFNIKPV